MTQESGLSKPHQRLTGILHMTGASLAFALMVLCVKWAVRGLPVFEVIFFRSVTGTLLIGMLILRKKVSFWGKDHGLLLLRGISGFTALALHFFTISKLPLGLAVMLNFTAPVFAAVFAVFFLKEKPGFFLWTMILMSFAGVFFITVPSGMSLHTGGPKILFIFLGLLSGLFAAIAYVSIRGIKHHESPLTIIFYFTFISMVGSAFFLPAGMRWPEPLEWLALLGVAVGSFFGQLGMTVAFRKAPASLVSPFSYLTPAFAFLFGFIFWEETITAHTIIGTVLIFLAGSLVSLREAVYE